MTQTHMTESEIEKGFHLEATAQEIIDGNEPFCATQPWSFPGSNLLKCLWKKDSHHIVFLQNNLLGRSLYLHALLSSEKWRIR